MAKKYIKQIAYLLTIGLMACNTVYLPPNEVDDKPLLRSSNNDSVSVVQENSRPVYSTLNEELLNTIIEENRKLSEKITALELRQDNLERSIAVLGEVYYQQEKNDNKPSDSSNQLELANKAFNNHQYVQTINLLANVKHTPSSLWLLANSHEKLKHFESAIHVAKQLIRQFPQSDVAPDAYLLIARCQKTMQQKDIARDTLNTLHNTYPDSPAAKTAQQLLKK
ncbi:MAG: tetratricopeptide repeat protein [Neisseriaceae bacterium]|nr:tetratricopeptide repeat protein [Neisseriaceae bacterium]